MSIRVNCPTCGRRLTAPDGAAGKRQTCPWCSATVSVPCSVEAPVPTLDLVRRTTCPHCWKSFAPEDVLWVSIHTDLRGDPRLGPDHLQRFLPTRFTPDGAALDAKGFACTGLACPACHLPLPRALLEMEPVFVSILGTPSCGKSYYLAALTWGLRQTLPREFGLAFTDADPAANITLSDYEKALFLNQSADTLTPLADLIRKTELQGELYDTVSYGNQSVSYPRPFMFSVRPLPGHPNDGAGNRAGRVICLYDNAGEHCLPGQDSATAPATHHLARSRFLLYLFDPTQDPRFRRRCGDRPGLPLGGVSNRQETVLLEMAARVRRFTGLGHGSKHDRPLVVVVTKSDVWSGLLADCTPDEPWERGNGPVAGLDMRRIEDRSRALRALLAETCPEVVTAAEGFASTVLYVPVSALGTCPTADPATGRPAIRPCDIRPVWVTVPLLVGLREAHPGLVSRLKPRAPVAAPYGPPPAHPRASGWARR